MLKIFYLFCVFNLTFCLSIPSMRVLNRKITDTNNVNFVCSNWDGNTFDSLIFEGGGVRAVVYSGAIKRLEEEDMLCNIKNIAGTSSGAQTAALVCSGYNSNELEECLRNAPWDKILNNNIFRGIYLIINKYGFFNGKYLEEYLEELLYNKTGKKKITFLELYEISNIHLKIGVCSLTDQDFKYIDHLSYPDMPVSLGLRASSSIPFIFTYTEWKNEIFIDGGLIGNLPTTSFPDNKCLAFNLISSDEYMHESKKNPKNIFGFIRVILNILFKNAKKIYSPKNDCIKNIDFIEIYTANIGILDRNMNNGTIKNLIEHGYNATDFFFKS